MNHTPGPWTCFPTSNGNHDYRLTLPNGRVLQVKSLTEQTATAHLIAAAPDLLTALVNLLVVCPVNLDRKAYAAGLDAIGAATGKNPGDVITDAMLVMKEAMS